MSSETPRRMSDLSLPFVNGSGEVFATVSCIPTNRVTSGVPRHPMMPRISKYLSVIEAMDISNARTFGLQDKTQSTHRRPALKKKGGQAPEDYTIIELRADLRKAYDADDVRTAIIIFAQLSRYLPL